MNRAIVDTNVPLAASDAVALSKPCVEASLTRVRDIVEGRTILVLDTTWLILAEYQANLGAKGPQSIAYAFLKWVLTNRENPARCEQVHIHPLANARMFEEFPADEALRSFDPADKKFVAVSCAHENRPHILQALDSKWWDFREPLAKAGVTVSFLCEHEIKVGFSSKRR